MKDWLYCYYSGNLGFGSTMYHKKEALPVGGPMSPVWILKRLVSVFINACRLLSALPSLLQFGPGRLSLVVISFFTLSLLFRPCRLLEFTLTGPQKRVSVSVCLTIVTAMVIAMFWLPTAVLYQAIVSIYWVGLLVPIWLLVIGVSGNTLVFTIFDLKHCWHY